MAEITSLVINFNGSNNSTAFVDETGKTITLGGSPIISTTQSKFGGSSGYFNGGSYLDVQSSVNLSMLADFTVELWVYTDPTTAAWSRLIENEQYNVTGGWHFSYNGSDSSGSRRLGFQLGLNGGGGRRIDSDSAIPTNQWIHIAVTRYNNTIRMFVNGSLQTATLITTEAFSSQSLRIGATLGSESNYFIGYIDSIQIIKNRALYTENFTVPTEQPQYDLYYDHTSLLIPFDGPNNSTVFGDYSPNRNIITAYGNAKISTTQSKFGGSSGYFDGASNLEIPSTNIALCSSESTSSTGTVDFTVECWIYCSGTNNFTLYCLGAPGSGTGNVLANMGGLKIYMTSGSVVYIMAGNLAADGASGFLYLKTSNNIPSSGWTHIAVTSISNVPHVFINGVESSLVIASGTWTSTTFVNKKLYSPHTINIMSVAKYNGVTDTSVASSSTFSTGYLDELRITKGIARRTGNFTPPTQAFYKPYNYDPFFDMTSLLLHMNGDNNSTTFKDSSTNGSIVSVFGDAKISTTQSKFGGSSGYFDGNGDYLTIPDSIVFNFGTNDFTFECWIYPTAYPSTSSDICVTNGATNGCGLRLQSNGTIAALFNISGTAITAISITAVPLNTWTHISQTRSNLTAGKIFINGILETTVTLGTGSQNYPGIGVCVGRNPTNSSWYYTGYINELRITKGVARHTTTFTPSAYRFYDIAPIQYFYGVYNDHLICKPGEVIGDFRTNSIFYSQEPMPFEDMEDGGTYFIEDYVTYNGAPASRRVDLYILQSRRLIRSVWSDPITGYYSFDRIKPQLYFVWCEDYLRVFDPVTHLVQVGQ